MNDIVVLQLLEQYLHHVTDVSIDADHVLKLCSHLVTLKSGQKISVIAGLRIY